MDDLSYILYNLNEVKVDQQLIDNLSNGITDTSPVLT